MKSAPWLPLLDQLADPLTVVRAAAEAEETGRHGVFVCDHLRWRAPAKVARESVTLDLLSRGRLTLGVGIGSDRFGGEPSKTGEQLDGRIRAQMLDEALAILSVAWSGQTVAQRGEHYTVDGVQLLPRPVQPAGVPVWAPTSSPRSSTPSLRCANSPDATPPSPRHGHRSTTLHRPAPFAAAGATWWLVALSPKTATIDRVRSVIHDDPAPQW